MLLAALRPAEESRNRMGLYNNNIVVTMLIYMQIAGLDLDCTRLQHIHGARSAENRR